MKLPTPLGPRSDAEVATVAAELGLPGLVDIHVHFMPERVQAKVWAHFDRLDPPWPVVYRIGEAERLAVLARMGVRHHTALAYAHRPDMAAWLNQHTMALARANSAVVATFTFFPEPGVVDYVRDALDEGGACAKVHLQVGRFDANHPFLDPVWEELQRRRTVVVLHAGAVEDGSGGEEFCGPKPVTDLLERFPDLVLVIAHLGAPDYAAFVGLAENTPNVFLDTAMGSPIRLTWARSHPTSWPGWVRSQTK